MKSPPPGLSFRPTGQNTLGGGRICHIVTLIWFFVPFLQIHFIVLMYEIKIGCNEKTSPKTLSGMLLDKIELVFLIIQFAHAKACAPLSPYSKKGSIGTWTWHYGSKIQNEFEVCHSLLSKHSLADARGIFGGSLMGVYRCVKSRDTVYKRRHVLSFSWWTGAQCQSRIEWELFVSN